MVCASNVEEEGLQNWAEQVYRLCDQEGPLSFQNCYPERFVSLVLEVFLACRDHS